MALTILPRLFSYSRIHFATMKVKVFVLALALALVGCGGKPQVATSTVPRSGVVFFGDSIFGRWNIDADFPGKGYVNGGMYGYRTDQLLEILPAVLSGERVCHGLAGNDTAPLVCQSIPAPATIVIEAGWNNFFQGNKGNTALPDITSMVKLAQSKGVRVIVTTLYAYDPAHPAPWMVPTGNAPVTFYDMWRLPLNGGIEKIQGVTVVDLSGVFAGQSGYTLDGVHPINAAYSQMRDVLNPAL
jgi:GDSL-like Lipase/Acylhydrolase family